MIFQQNSANPHVTNDVVNKLKQFFRENLITKNGLAEWPPTSPDMSAYFFLWGYMKAKLYWKKFDNIEEMKKTNN